MAEEMPCRELYLAGILGLGKLNVIMGPPPDGHQPCYAKSYELRAPNGLFRTEAEAAARLDELRMYESRSLMGMPDG